MYLLATIGFFEQDDVRSHSSDVNVARCATDEEYLLDKNRIRILV